MGRWSGILFFQDGKNYSDSQYRVEYDRNRWKLKEFKKGSWQIVDQLFNATDDEIMQWLRRKTQ